MVTRGEYVHSRYNGWPRLASVFKEMPERRIKGLVEPAIIILVGVVIFDISESLGTYLVFAGVALALSTEHINAIERHKVGQMHDAWIEQQILMERFREMQRGRYR